MVTVEMSGKLETVELEGTFLDTVNSLNLHAASGKEFIVTRLNTGEHFAMKMSNILTITETDEEVEIPSAV